MQQSGAAEVRILTENLYKFHVFGGNKLIREFSDKGCNVKSLNKLLKKVRHADISVQWENEREAADVAVCVLTRR